MKVGGQQQVGSANPWRDVLCQLRREVTCVVLRELIVGDLRKRLGSMSTERDKTPRNLFCAVGGAVADKHTGILVGDCYFPNFIQLRVVLVVVNIGVDVRAKIEVGFEVERGGRVSTRSRTGIVYDDPNVRVIHPAARYRGELC